MNSVMASKSVRLTGTGVIILIVGGLLLLYASYTYWSAVIFSRTPQLVNMSELLTLSVELAVRGGNLLWSIRKGHSSAALDQTVKGKTKEGANELLTKGDIESHRIMRYGFNKRFPHLKVISEEHDAINPVQSDMEDKIELPVIDLSRIAEYIPSTDITVWIDPLDATQEYSENLLHYVTTMVCVAVKGRPTIGVIYQPFNKLIAWAYVGHGLSASLKEAQERAQPTSNERNTKIIVSRSHKGDVQNVVKRALGENAQVIPAGGAGYKVLQVVNASVDAYVHTTRIKKWDICAGNAILTAVGGQMTTLNGQLINYTDAGSAVNDNGLLATVHQHDKFLKVFADYSKKATFNT